MGGPVQDLAVVGQGPSSESTLAREAALALYRPIRAALRQHMADATRCIGRTDVVHAAKALGLWHRGTLVADEGEFEMLQDVAMFAATRRGVRPIDRYRRAMDAQAPDDVACIDRVSRAVFSVFRIARRHPSAGLYLKDLLVGGEPFWLMDEALESSAPIGGELAMRVFDAGPFYAGFGVCVPISADLGKILCSIVDGAGHPLGLDVMLYVHAIYDIPLELALLEIAAAAPWQAESARGGAAGDDAVGLLGDRGNAASGFVRPRQT